MKENVIIITIIICVVIIVAVSAFLLLHKKDADSKCKKDTDCLNEYHCDSSEDKCISNTCNSVFDCKEGTVCVGGECTDCVNKVIHVPLNTQWYLIVVPSTNTNETVQMLGTILYNEFCNSKQFKTILPDNTEQKMCIKYTLGNITLIPIDNTSNKLDPANSIVLKMIKPNVYSGTVTDKSKVQYDALFFPVGCNKT